MDMSDRLSDMRSEGDLNLSEERLAWQSSHISLSTRETLDEDSRHFLHQSLSTPCLNVLEGAEGPYIIDDQGRRILDFHGNWVHQVGFGHPKVVEAIVEQIRQLSFCPRRYTNRPAIELARKLGQLAPGNLNKVLLAPGGSLAIGMALKLARLATGRFKTLSMWDSFHGAGLDAISIGGEAIFRQNMGPLLTGAEHAPPPDPSSCPWECGSECTLHCARYVDYVLGKEGDTAAVISETVRSIPFVPPKAYWQIIREACDQRGTLLILDEIPHALGRTGAMFTCEHYDVTPDILVIGKGLGGGIFPLAAMIVRDDLEIAGERALGHYTHEKNPVACAAALATIRVVEEEQLVLRAQMAGRWALRELERMANSHRILRAARGIGLMLGLEVVDPEDEGRADTIAEKIMYEALSRGLSFKLTMGNMILLVPALTITDSQLSSALSILDDAVQAVEKKLIV